jgi:hypothetical protein
MKPRILERAGHICGMDGSRTTEENLKRDKNVVVDRQGS